MHACGYDALPGHTDGSARTRERLEPVGLGAERLARRPHRHPGSAAARGCP
ncbi:hypothetical protein [Streptomyces sp. F001]|uniref:hypothetical protein n=1 Tax=Streptomyces sp. F001 TaxID=1510026 RepID=UPI0013EE8E35|nr:hypothetical protein [Streptomyces sp. F001]